MLSLVSVSWEDLERVDNPLLENVDGLVNIKSAAGGIRFVDNALLPDLVDSDGDFVADSVDEYPEISLNGRSDVDGDGIPDACDESCLKQGLVADLDNDNDGFPDSIDDFALDKSASSDYDGDGKADYWNLGFSRSDSASGLVLDADDDADGYGDLRWSQIGEDIDGEASGDQSGGSIDLSADGSVLAVGAWLNAGSDGALARAGHVRVYELVGSEWRQKGKDIDGDVFDSNSGSKVKLSDDGSIVASGAPGWDYSTQDSGYLKVYKWIENQWQQLGTDIFEKQEAGALSFDLSADGLVAAVGVNRGPKFGEVRVYEYVTDEWKQVGETIEGDSAGDRDYQVALSGDGETLAVGGEGYDGLGDRSGHVRIYHRLDSGWVLKGSELEGAEENALFGAPLALSHDGSTVVVGSGYGVTPAGRANVYKWHNSRWSQQGQPIMTKSLPSASAGALAVSADGSKVLLNTGVSDDRGTVGLYSWVKNRWLLTGEEIHSEANFETSGLTVAISSTGDRIAVGSPSNDVQGSKSDAGHVRVFSAEDDLFPFDDAEWEDSDRDGIGDNSDEDVTHDLDLDGLPASSDNCPLVSNVDQANLDEDSEGDLCDEDDDNDGQTDEDELVCGSNPQDKGSISLDYDADDYPDCVDKDDDNDGVDDALDFYPLDASRFEYCCQKALIVAGGGPYFGNALWPATKNMANFAYETLLFQGLDDDDIIYLSEEESEHRRWGSDKRVG